MIGEEKTSSPALCDATPSSESTEELPELVSYDEASREHDLFPPPPPPPPSEKEEFAGFRFIDVASLYPAIMVGLPELSRSSIASSSTSAPGEELFNDPAEVLAQLTEHLAQRQASSSASEKRDTPSHVMNTKVHISVPKESLEEFNDRLHREKLEHKASLERTQDITAYIVQLVKDLVAADFPVGQITIIVSKIVERLF